MESSRSLRDAWKEVLGLCNLKPHEYVVVITGENTIAAHLETALAIIDDMGCSRMTMRLGEPPRQRVGGDTTTYAAPTALTGNVPAIAALKAADFVLDMMGLYRGSEQEEILKEGARILLVKEPPDVFIRLKPRLEDRTRVKAAEARIQVARQMRVRSAAGTDFTVRFGAYPWLTQYGFADEPGRWDHAPSAFIARWPDEGSSNGVVVLDAGDTILPLKRYVQSPIRLDIKDGYVRRIDGGPDASYLRDYMESFKDPEGFAVSHLGWGLHSRAHWTMLGMYDKQQTVGMDARSYEGNFMFSTGPNSEAGGSRHTPCHLDIPMSRCSVWLDDELMVDQGRVIAN